MAEFKIPTTDTEGYNLICQDLKYVLMREMYRQNVATQEHYDLTMEFFLYLRDGAHPEEPHQPYQMMATIHDSNALACWVGTTFRRWLIKRLKNAGREVVEEIEDREERADSARIFESADLMRVVLLLEAVNESYSPQERLVFFSDLMDLKNGMHKHTDVLALQLQITENNVRVIRHRLKKHIQETLKSLPLC